MQDRIFEINNIPEVPNVIEEKAENSLNEIINNYETLTKDSLKIVELSLENNIVKPLTLYNLFFLIEIYLKSFLIKYSSLSVIEISNIKHNIFNLIENANDVEPKINFNKLKFLIANFKNKNQKGLEIQKYYDFKYNHKKEDDNLIFDYIYSEKELKNIKDVIDWINCRI